MANWRCDVKFQHFDLPEQSGVAADANSVVHTPLGDVKFEISLGGNLFRIDTARRCKLNSLGFGLIWESDVARIELICNQFDPQMPSDITVSGSFGTIIRVHARTDLPSIQAIARWINGCQGVDQGPSNGELLVAREWSNQEWTVTIGTEDADACLRRAIQSFWMPNRLRPDPDDWYKEWGKYSFSEVDSVHANIPNLLRDETCQLQFVIAWNRTPDECSTWLAAEQNSEYLLHKLISSSEGTSK